MYGDAIDELTKERIFTALTDNVSYIKQATGTELGNTECNQLAEYISKSSTIKELTAEKLATQPMAKYTKFTSVMFSTLLLVALVAALMLLLVLIIIYCKGYWHKIIGIAVIIASAIVGTLGYLFNPAYNTASTFTKSVVSVVVKSFNNTSLAFAAVAGLFGIFVLLVGKAMSDDDDEYDEEA